VVACDTPVDGSGRLSWALVTAPPPDLLAYHLGFVVHDLDAVADRYSRMLGVDRWRTHELPLARVPWDPRSTDARLKVAFGRAVGMTFELIQVREGRTPHLDFLEKHGEGIQHIGIWAPDVRAAVEHAVSQGGRLTLARYDDDGQSAVVQLSPGSGQEAILASLDRARLGYVDPGLGGVQLEFVGPSAPAGLRAWMEEDFERIMVPPPPWERATA
jgi:catechol 2,3-dioxygenase-like lactoylglutathione lyase family enzyme